MAEGFCNIVATPQTGWPCQAGFTYSQLKQAMKQGHRAQAGIADTSGGLYTAVHSTPVHSATAAAAA